MAKRVKYATKESGATIQGIGGSTTVQFYLGQNVAGNMGGGVISSMTYEGGMICFRKATELGGNPVRSWGKARVANGVEMELIADFVAVPATAFKSFLVDDDEGKVAKK